MAEVIPFTQLRRSKRLSSLLVEQVGLEHFTEGKTFLVLVDARIEEAVKLCAGWLEHQTDAGVSATVRNIIRVDIKKHLLTKIAEHMVQLFEASEQNDNICETPKAGKK